MGHIASSATAYLYFFEQFAAFFIKMNGCSFVFGQFDGAKNTRSASPNNCDSHYFFLYNLSNKEYTKPAISQNPSFLAKAKLVKDSPLTKGMSIPIAKNIKRP